MPKPLTLTAEMSRCLDFVKRHGDQIHRHPGGFWSSAQWKGEHCGITHFGTSTVEALVKRHYLAYDQWQESRAGKFPIRAVRLEERETNP